MTVWSSQFSWTSQSGGLTGMLGGKGPAHLNSGNQLYHFGRYITSARKVASPGECLAGCGACRSHELVVRQFVRHPGLLCSVNYSKTALVDADWSLASDSDTAETVSRLCDQGLLTEAVEALGILVQTDCCIPKDLIYAILKKCVVKKDLVLGRLVHAFTVKVGYESDTFLGNHILRMYASQGRLQDAMGVFEAVAKPDAFMWSSIISAHAKHGQDKQALQLYRRMRRSSVKPDGHVYVAALQACTRGLDLKTGQLVHTDVLASGIEPDLFVWSCLVDMYAKCGSLEEAQGVFDGLHTKDAVTWNAMIAGYSQQGMGLEALRLYRAMQEEGMAVPDSVTFLCLLQACASVGTPALEIGKELHAQIRERGHQDDGFVANSLVNMYSKCGSLEDAQRVFDGLVQKDVVTWNALIAGYSQQSMGQKALNLYHAMQLEGIASPDCVTFVYLLQACANVAALHLGRQLHARIEQQGLQGDIFVAGSLINMYGKAGSMVDAQQVFDALQERDVVAWSALIGGYSCQGDSEVVFDLVYKMLEDGIQPVGVTFLSVLAACSHAGLVNKGKDYFEAMSKIYGITPTVEHYTCMVDLLGRAGRLNEALVLARSLPVLPNTALWHNLLGACQKWKNVEVGRLVFNEAVKLDEKDVTAYVTMSNIYICVQMWEHAAEMQARRIGIKAWKQPGESWWTDTVGVVHSFLVGEQKHRKGQARLKRPLSRTEGKGQCHI